MKIYEICKNLQESARICKNLQALQAHSDHLSFQISKEYQVSDGLVLHGLPIFAALPRSNHGEESAVDLDEPAQDGDDVGRVDTDFFVMRPLIPSVRLCRQYGGDTKFIRQS